MGILGQCLMFVVIFSAQHTDLFHQSGAGPATLLVTTDLDCQWKLDGVAQGKLVADDARTVNVSMGKHLIQATTLDSLDSWRTVIEISREGQEIVEIKLKTVRDARLYSEKGAREAAARAAEDAKPTWTDTGTGLMWQKEENGFDVTWNEARDYCRDLELAGYSDWRLPSIDQLEALYDPKSSVGFHHIKGRIQLADLTSLVWSSSLNGTVNDTEDAWGFSFRRGERISNPLLAIDGHRALCVRRAGR